MSKKNHSHEAAPVQEPAAEAQDGAAAETPPSAEAAVQADLSALKDRMLRLQADFDNFRKRTSRERVELFQRANEDLMRELLPVLDHFELGMQTAEKQGLDPAVKAGFKMVQDQMTAALTKFGLSPVESVGLPFDPNVHEAVTQVPAVGQAPHTVLQELRRGYRLGNQLLRASQVVIAAETPPSDAGGPVAAGGEAPGHG